MPSPNDLAIRQQLNDIETVLATPAAMRFLSELIVEFGVFRTVFDDDPHRTAHMTGLHMAGLRIINRLEQGDPDALLRLAQTAAAARKEAVEAAEKHNKEVDPEL